MNIFYLDDDPKVCATYHCDKHVVKMILESAQLLSTAHWETGGKGPYRATYKYHPCAVWARQSLENYQWLCILGLALCKEYRFRYDKTHKTEDKLLWLWENPPTLPLKQRTPLPSVMPEVFICKDSLTSYHKYYKFGKKHLHQWTKRDIPPFLEEITWEAE